MAFLDDFKGFLCNKLQIPAATVNLYNGNKFVYKGCCINKINNRKKEVFFYESNFDLMQQCASLIRLSKSSFQFSLVANETLSSFILPYSRYISLIDSNNRLVYRILHHHLDLDDIKHCDSEAFNYIYHQTKADLVRFIETSEHLDKRLGWIISSFGLIFAALQKRLNLKNLKFEWYLKFIDIPSHAFMIKHSKEILTKCHEYALKYRTADECNFFFVKNVKEMLNTKNFLFQVSASIKNIKLPAQEYGIAKLVVSDIEVCLASENGLNVFNLEYKQLTKIKLQAKCKAIHLILIDSTIIEISFLSDCFQEVYSFLSVIDLYFRSHIKTRMLIEPVLNSHFDPYSMAFNELNPAQKSSNIYNIIEKSLKPLNFLSMTQGRKILKDLGYKAGWYILLKPTSHHVYPMTIVLNAEANGEKKIPLIRILNKDGYFMVDERASQSGSCNMVTRYHSLEQLINGITISIGNKKIRPVQLVSEEMVVDLRKNMIECENDLHKQSHILSLHCIQLVPNSFFKKNLCTSYLGKWTDPNGHMTNIIAFLYDKKCMDKESLTSIAKVAEISRAEFVHENILRCHGFADDGYNTIYYIHENFGFEIVNTFMQGYSIDQIFEFGRQIKNALIFLHDRDIVHGFPALQNVYINQSLTQVKLGNIGILSAIMQGYSSGRPDGESSSVSSFLKAAKYPGFNEVLAKWFSQRRIKMLHEYPEEKLQETWDRYVFGCTLWQLFNEGATPLPEKSDQDILDKLEGKDCSWFSGGAYFRLPNTQTEFLNKLQKIICVCVTWGNKDNLEKYEFRKIAETYEKLADVVSSAEVTTSDFILKAGNGKLDFDVNVNVAEGANNKYTLVEENDNQRVVLVSSKKNNILAQQERSQLTHVQDMLAEKGKLLQLSDLESLGGGRFVAPLPGSAEVEASCRKFTLNQNVWVKSYSKCKDIPEEDFIEEVKHLLNFQHPNIVPLRGAVLLEETLLLITPCYKFCKSLREFLDNNDHMITSSQRESYAQQVCAGMKYLAINKCMHRNLRLAHIYLTNYHNIVITNFGLARVTDALYYQQKRALNADTFVIYPPEVISVMCGGGKVKFNTACDVWSYGVLLWELYSGDVAYNNVVMDIHGNQDINLLDDHFREGNTLDTDPNWPSNIRTIIEKCQHDEDSRTNFFEIDAILTSS